MDFLGGKLFGCGKHGNVPVLDFASPWKKKSLHNAIYFKYESVSATSDNLETIIGSLKSDCYLKLFENSFECEFRHGKLLDDISPHTHGVSEDRETLTDPVTTEENKRISHNCEELEKKVNELTTEIYEEKYLRQGSESAFQMMKEEYIRVTSALKANFSLKTQQQQDIFEQTVKEKITELKLISNKLDKVETERDIFQKELFDLHCNKTNMVENYGKMLKSLYDEKTVMKNQFETLLSELMTENNALKVKSSDLKLKVDNLNIIKNNYYEELQKKDTSLRNQMELLKSKEATINTLNIEIKMIQEHNALSVDAFQQKVDHLTLVKNNCYAELQMKDNDLRNQKELLKRQEETIYLLINEKKVIKNNLKFSVEKLATVTSTVHKNELKIRKELETLLLNLQKETKAVQEHEHFIEFLNKGNRFMLLLSDALLNERKAHKVEVSKLKEQIDDFMLIKNNPGKEIETMDIVIKNQRELLKSQEETILLLNNKKKVIQNNFEILVEESPAVTGSEHKTKIQKELEILLSNLRMETNTVQKNEQFIQLLYNDNRNLRVLSKALLHETVKRKTDVPKLKLQIDHLIMNLVEKNIDKESLIKNNVDKELQAKDDVFRKNISKIQKELQELLLNLQKESINVQKYEKMMKYFNNEYYSTLSKMKTQNNLLRIETSDLKRETVKLSSVNNYLHEELQTRDNQLACMTTDVLILRNDLELALVMVKLLTGNTESKNSQSELTNCKQVTDEK